MKITIIETPTHQGIYFGNDLVRVGEDTDRLDLWPTQELARAMFHETEVVKGRLDGFPAFLPDALRVLDVEQAQPVNPSEFFGVDPKDPLGDPLVWDRQEEE